MHKMMFFEPVFTVVLVLLLHPVIVSIGLPPLVTVLMLIGASIHLFMRWIEYKTVEQVLTNKRVFYKRGLISRDTDEIRNDAVESISVRQSIPGRLFGYGSVDFTGRGSAAFSFDFVPKPFKIKREFESDL